MTPSLSIIIPTYMREKVLWDTIECLMPQCREGDELWVVDQNTPPLSLPPHLRKPGLNLVHLQTPSLTRARNLGIQKSRQGLLVFLDDDIIPASDLLDQFRQITQEFPNCILTGIVNQNEKSDDIPSPGFVDLGTGEIKTNFSRPISGEIPFFPGGLVLIPKACLPSPPYFCPAFRGASQGEEIDFAFRVRQRGTRIIADPRIHIFHLKVLEGGCRAPDFRQRFYLDQLYNHGLFFGRHGNLFSLGNCLLRLKGFVEFHTRIYGGKTHSLTSVFRAFTQLAMGLLTGIRLRFF